MVVRTVAVEAKELAAAGCAHALRGGGGGGGVGGLHRYSHRAAQLEEEQDKREKRAARCECGRHCISARGVRSRKRACRPTIRVGAEESDALSLARWAAGHFRLRSLFELDMLAFRTSFRFLQSSDHNHTCSKTLSVLSVQIMYFQSTSRQFVIERLSIEQVMFLPWMSRKIGTNLRFPTGESARRPGVGRAPRVRGF